MRTNKLFASIAATLCLVSCSDILEEQAYSILTDDLAFTTGENAQAAVNGMYYSLHTIYTFQCYYGDICADSGFKQGDIFEIMNDPNIQAIISNDYMWSLNYFTIARANVIIETIPQMDPELFEAVHTPEQMVAEARFMRAYSYINLTDLYYQVPLTLSSNLDVRDIRHFDSIESIEAAIETDLQEAKKGLPLSYAKSEASRPTFGAACGMLCRLYMRQGGRHRQAGNDAQAQQCWQKALDEANAILDLEGKEYSLQKTAAAPFDASSEAGLYNNELIFAVRASDSISNCSWYIGLQYTPWEYDYGWGEFYAPLELAWAFDPEDTRLITLIVRDFYQYQTNEKRVHLTPTSVDKVGGMLKTLDDSYELTYCAENIGVCTRKYAYQKPGTYNYDTGNNYPVLRLADIILCKAEILNELNGPTKEAVDLVNRIRKRAFQNTSHNYSVSSFSNKEQFRNAICDERLFELNMEGVRRVDLIRMGLWKDRMDKYISSQKAKAEWKERNEGKESGYYKSDYIGYPTDLSDNDIRRYFPIPQFELDLNPELGNARTF